MSKNQTYMRLINSQRWMELRKRKISECPICEECKKKGIYMPTEEIHHIKPVEDARSEEEMERRMYDYFNLKALCRECHHEAHRQLKSMSREANRKRVNEANDLFRKKFLSEEGGGFF
jgi:5-methylcytosine-specific restriction protein A